MFANTFLGAFNTMMFLCYAHLALQDTTSMKNTGALHAITNRPTIIKYRIVPLVPVPISA